MSTMILRVKVKDYGSWRQFFDTGQSRREAFGLSDGRVFRAVEDAAACVLSDRSNDGRRHMTEFIRRFPLHWTGQPSARSFTATVFALKQPDDADRFSDALREAGMPE